MQATQLLHNLGQSISAQRTYVAARELFSSPHWQRAYKAGARPQRLLWANTGIKDPQAWHELMDVIRARNSALTKAA